jgi:Tfp pilus assembly protein PilP
MSIPYLEMNSTSKREGDTLSEWVKAVRSLIQTQINKAKKVNEYKSNIYQFFRSDVASGATFVLKDI